MRISEEVYNLMGIMPCATMIFDVKNQTVVACNVHSQKMLGIYIGSTLKDIEMLANNSLSFKKIYIAVKAELQKHNKCELRNYIINTNEKDNEHCDVHITYLNELKEAIYIVFSRSEHEIELMSQQKLYYNSICTTSYSYPFYLDVKARRIQLYDPELEKYNMSMVMENFPEQVLKSGYIYEEDKEIYMNVVNRMYRGEPPEGSFRFYDPNGELLTYSLYYVVNRDELGEPIEISGDFIIQSEAKLEEMNNIFTDDNAKPQQKVVLAHQIKAHFFFNTLNTISALCRQDAIKADNAIRTFATYMRSYMYLISEDENIEFSQELVLVKSTLEIEKLRFPDSFTYQLDLQETDFDIPPLTIQPIVENALLHGLRRTGKHGNLKISSHRCGDVIRVVVSDNGLGFHKSVLEKTKSIGLRNLTKRIEIMSNGTVTINSTLGVGTEVVIEIPIDENI